MNKNGSIGNTHRFDNCTDSLEHYRRGELVKSSHKPPSREKLPLKWASKELAGRQPQEPKPIKKGSILTSQFYGTIEERTADEEARKALTSVFKGHPVKITTQDDEELEGAYFFNPLYKTDVEHSFGEIKAEPTGKTYVYCSGSHGTWERYGMAIIPKLLCEGHRVLAFDYCGFGKNLDKKITIPNLKDSTISAVNYVLKQKKVSLDNVVLLGYSLGGPLAAYAAAELNIQTLIIDRGILSFTEAAASSAPSGLSAVAAAFAYIARHLSTLEYLENFKGSDVRIILGESEQKTVKEFQDCLETLKEKNIHTSLASFPTLGHERVFDSRLFREINVSFEEDEEKAQDDTKTLIAT